LPDPRIIRAIRQLSGDWAVPPQQSAEPPPRTAWPAAQPRNSRLLPPSRPPPPQSDNGYDREQHEQIYKSIRTTHRRTLRLPPTPSDNLPEIWPVPPPQEVQKPPSYRGSITKANRSLTIVAITSPPTLRRPAVADTGFNHDDVAAIGATRRRGSMYRTIFLAWLAVMVIFAADITYLGWDLVAVAAGLR
jgi:hypothetical protein